MSETNTVSLDGVKKLRDMTGAGMIRGWFYRVGDDGRWTREANPDECDCGNDRTHLRHVSALHIVEAYLAAPDRF